MYGSDTTVIADVNTDGDVFQDGTLDLGALAASTTAQTWISMRALGSPVGSTDPLAMEIWYTAGIRDSNATLNFTGM